MESTPPTRILMILPHTGAGGDTQVIYNLLHALHSDSYEFHLLTHQRGSLHEDFRQFAQVHTFPIDDMPWTRRLLRRFLLPIFIRLKKGYGSYLLRKIKPDIIYINTVNEHEFSQVALRSSRKVVVHIHEMGFVVTQRMRAQWIAELLDRAHTIISPAQAVSDFYRDVYGSDESKVRLLHEVVSDTRLGTPAIPKSSLREQLGLPEGTLLIGSVGSVIYRKGVDTFIRACAILKQKFPEQTFVFLWLGGDPKALKNQPYYRALCKTIEREDLTSHFRFLPQTATVGSFYADLDIFVLPSRMEAFPLVVLEALLAEKPVVAMDVAGVREAVDTETGYLVKDRTPEGLAEGIQYFMQNETRRIEAGQKGRSIVLEKYEAKVQVEKWLHILENV